MIEDKYQNFFKKINIFLLEIEEKKLRGINDYNMLSIIRGKKMIMYKMIVENNMYDIYF